MRVSFFLLTLLLSGLFGASTRLLRGSDTSSPNVSVFPLTSGRNNAETQDGTEVTWLGPLGRLFRRRSTTGENETGPSWIYGDWYQMYSSKSVQDTTEMDWHCVVTHFTPDGVYKTARVHGPEAGTTIHTILRNFTLNETTMTIGSTVLFQGQQAGILDVRIAEPNNLLVVTGRSTPVLFVWVKDPQAFASDEETKVLGLLDSWNYTGHFKAPVCSYNLTECVGS